MLELGNTGVRAPENRSPGLLILRQDDEPRKELVTGWIEGHKVAVIKSSEKVS